MAEIDFQMAVVLQYRFEQEFKAAKNAQKLDVELARQLQEKFEQEAATQNSPSNVGYKTQETRYDSFQIMDHTRKLTEKSDQELARQLQEQFEQEKAIENPTSGLVYKRPQTDHNSSRSLVDPSWELVDPTPDIHNLFMVFNQKFFWNKLLAVCVSWSQRMTTCAGVCSYNGRGGMCCITLSGPLLKLRPRKDLVETLLHEMIHAYLFVTHNNRDRDGHGPEFHKHMYRINKESGTNITVYHDFYDEVRLYQQHWWRCNGPCQHWKPYFGVIRRASNRAPGPNDRWWPEHSRTCGGTFTKVREPEKDTSNVKKKEVPKATTNGKNIRDYMVSAKKSASSNSNNNIKGIKDVSTAVKGKYNSSSTIVVTKNNKTTEITFKPTVFNAGSSSGSTKTETKNSIRTNISTNTDYSGDFLSVRNHWASKFSNTNKRPAPVGPSSSSKVQRVVAAAPSIDALAVPSTSSQVQPLSKPVPSDDAFCECPVCSKKVLMSDLNSHLDVCLTELSTSVKPEVAHEPDEEMKECPLCNKNIASSSFDTHVEMCVMKVYDGVEEKLGSKSDPEFVSCLSCGKKILKTELNSHLDDCMIHIFDGEFDDQTDANSAELKDDKRFNCPFCMELVEEKDMKEHLDGCLKTEDVDVLESLTDDSF